MAGAHFEAHIELETPDWYERDDVGDLVAALVDALDDAGAEPDITTAGGRPGRLTLEILADFTPMFAGSLDEVVQEALSLVMGSLREAKIGVTPGELPRALGMKFSVATAVAGADSMLELV